jgi:hypothetical protein
MAFLMIFRKDEGTFVESDAFDKLDSIGVHRLVRHSMPGAAIVGHFQCGDDSVLVELKSDLRTFAISDAGPAGIEFAMRLQGEFDEPLRIVDEAYSFDFELKAFNTAAELQNAIRSSGL